MTYSVMVWTTPQFDGTFATEEDRRAFVDLMVVEANQGYVNSEMPVSRGGLVVFYHDHDR